MRKILKDFGKTDWLLVGVSLVFIFLSVWMDLKIPDYMADITTLVQTSGTKMSEILRAGGKMLAFALGSLASTVVTSIAASVLSAGFSASLRDRLFRKVQSFSMAEIGKFSTASLITRSTNDVVQIQMAIVIGLQMLLRAPIMAIWAIVKIHGRAWQWTAATAGAVGILLVVVFICIRLAMPKFKMMQELTDHVNEVTRENLTGLRVVRAYNAEAYQEKKFAGANQELTDANQFAMRTLAFLFPSIQFVINGLTLSIYWIGAYLIEDAGLSAKITTFSNMIVFTQYAIQVVMAFMMLVVIFMILPRALVAADRVNEVLETPVSITDGTRTEGAEGEKGTVEFRHVNFRYADSEEDVLHDITFSARQGETVALIGATGSGKSTIINLIPRFYDASEGEVLVDGVDVRDYTQKALRNKIGYISQSAVLFTGTIRSNIAYGDNGRGQADGEDVREAVSTAQADDFVTKLEDGYDAYVAPGGQNFSGGQRQRLSIARAIARKPEILIFDDSFSALDYKTDRALRNKLEETSGDATRIIVAQRIGTIRSADRIIVVDDGRIAGIGTHEELMKECEVYQQIALSQLSKEELA